MNRSFRTIRRGIGPYFRDLSPLRDARSPEQLRAWFGRRTPAELGFNGDVLRASIVHAAFQAARCSVFIETGTYRAETALMATRLLRCPVYSSELNPRHWLVAALRSLPVRTIHARLADSRAFLRQLVVELPRDIIPFVYLDAHWNQDLPLQAELDIVMSAWRRCIILIDDFEVPGKPEFGFDTYGGAALSLKNITFNFGDLASSSGVFFPKYDAVDDTGFRRGYVVAASGLRERLARESFPLNLLREHVPARGAREG